MANVAVPWLTHFYQDVPGFFWFEEGYRRMLETLPRTSPSVFVEIGSFHGRSTAYLAVEALNRGIPVTIHCVDSWQFPTPSEGAEARRDFGQHLAPVAVLLGERFVVHAMRSDEASRKFDDGSVDVVWIDGDHAHDAVVSDIRAWFPKLRSGGWMGGDDWCMRPVQQAVFEEFGTNYILVHGWTTNPTPQIWPSWLVRKG